jgi:hypothetical protein
LPKTRAAILSRVVRDIVARHEIRRGSSFEWRRRRSGTSGAA